MFEVAFRHNGNLYRLSLSRVPLKGERLDLITATGTEWSMIVLSVRTIIALDDNNSTAEVFHLQLGQA